MELNWEVNALEETDVVSLVFAFGNKIWWRHLSIKSLPAILEELLSKHYELLLE